jgi:hypothetical protein
MDAVPFGGRLPMAPLPPLQQLGFGISQGRLQANATSGLRADEGGHHLFLAARNSALGAAEVSQVGRLGGDGH